MCCLSVFEPKEEDIRKKAHEISQAKRAGGLHWTDSFVNWVEARDFLIKEFEANWTRGTVGV